MTPVLGFPVLFGIHSCLPKESRTPPVLLSVQPGNPGPWSSLWLSWYFSHQPHRCQPGQPVEGNKQDTGAESQTSFPSWTLLRRGDLQWREWKGRKVCCWLHERRGILPMEIALYGYNPVLIWTISMATLQNLPAAARSDWWDFVQCWGEVKTLNCDKMHLFLNSGKTPTRSHSTLSDKVHVVLTEGFSWVKTPCKI